ncbi:hypothetical protein ACH42_17600 [Endozoicomonas sp. (ex Bugula neritina AB1)]|nr:hypothetical protein ACH42_17600 [Endozoicomonas sp. (ex Bugula neritina AB1)]
MDPSKSSSPSGRNARALQSPVAIDPNKSDTLQKTGKAFQGHDVNSTLPTPSIPAGRENSAHNPTPSRKVTAIRGVFRSFFQWTKELVLGKTATPSDPSLQVYSDPSPNSVDEQEFNSSTIEKPEVTSPPPQANGWLPSWPAWLGGTVRKTEGKEIIHGARENEKPERALPVFPFVKTIATTGVSFLNRVTGGIFGEALTKKGAKAIRKRIQSTVKFPGLSDEQFKALLGTISGLVSDALSDSTTPRNILIPAIDINTGDAEPYDTLKIRNFSFTASPTKYIDNCPLIKEQQLKRSIRLNNLECFIDMPNPPMAEPSELRITMKKGTLTVGSDITNLTAIDAAKWATGYGSLGSDNSAFQLETPKLTVNYDKLHTATLFNSDDLLVPPDEPGMMAFHRGTTIFEKLLFSRPASLTNTPQIQSAIIQCGGFHFENERNRECLIDLTRVAVEGMYDTMTGKASADFSVDLGKTANFPNSPRWFRFFEGTHLDVKVNTPIKEGEIDFNTLKQGITVKAGRKNSPKSWFFSVIINAILGSKKTRIYKSPNGDDRLDIGFSIPVIGEILNRVLKSYITNIPLSGNMVTGRKGTNGRIIASNILSDLCSSILNDWFFAPAEVHMVRNDYEKLCNKAASGSLSSSRALMLAALEMEKSKHISHAVRMLEAIPYKHFGLIYDEAEIISVKDLNRMAHLLINTAPDKAIAIYAKTLINISSDNTPESFNADAMMKQASILQSKDASGKAIAMNIYEFLARAKPETGALERLIKMRESEEYTIDRMVALFPQVIRHTYYINNPKQQIDAMSALAPFIQPHTSDILRKFPTHRIERNYMEGTTSAKSILTSLAIVMVDNGQHLEMAKIYTRVADEAKAEKILNKAIQSGDTEALRMRVNGEISHGRYVNPPDSPQFISAYKLLTHIIEDNAASPRMRQCAADKLRSLWEKTRSLTIKWPNLAGSHGETDNPARQIIRNTRSQLFNISLVDYADPKKLLTQANTIAETLKNTIAVTADTPIRQTLSYYLSTVQQIAEEASAGTVFQSLADTTYKLYEQENQVYKTAHRPIRHSLPREPLPREPLPREPLQPDTQSILEARALAGATTKHLPWMLRSLPTNINDLMKFSGPSMLN